MKRHKAKPLFGVIKIEPGEFIQERRKKVAKLQLQQSVDNLEDDLYKLLDEELVRTGMKKFRRSIRKIMKNI